jgi:hypothetical protein
MADRVLTVWYAPPQRFRSLVRWSSRSDRGEMAFFPQRLVFSGLEGDLDIRMVKGVSIVRRPIPWLSFGADNVLLVLIVVSGASSFFTVGNPVTIPLIVAIDVVFLLLLGQIKWVEIEYVDESGETRQAYFTDGSSFGLGRALGGAEKLYEVIRSTLRLKNVENETADIEETAGGGDGAIAVSCEACGRANFFPASKRGTVQHCSHCNAHLDVEEEGTAG